MVLDEAGKAIAGKADKHLASLAVSFVEQPQYRLAGADEVLAQISESSRRPSTPCRGSAIPWQRRSASRTPGCSR